MANEVIDFTPIPRSLESDRHTNLGWKDALGELIDNSFDAGALRVEVIFGTKSVEVVDDDVDMPGSVIWLNENNATLQELRAVGNTSAVLLTALALFGSEVVNDEQRSRFPSMRDMSTFPQIFAYVAATIAEVKTETAEPAVA